MAKDEKLLALAGGLLGQVKYVKGSEAARPTEAVASRGGQAVSKTASRASRRRKNQSEMEKPGIKVFFMAHAGDRLWAALGGLGNKGRSALQPPTRTQYGHKDSLWFILTLMVKVASKESKDNTDTEFTQHLSTY